MQYEINNRNNIENMINKCFPVFDERYFFDGIWQFLSLLNQYGKENVKVYKMKVQRVNRKVIIFALYILFNYKK